MDSQQQKKYPITKTLRNEFQETEKDGHVTNEMDYPVKNHNHNVILYRRTRALAFLWNILKTVGLKLLGLGLQAIGVGVNIDSNRKMKENFKKVFEGLNRNYDAINRNYNAIKNVGEKVDRNFVALILLSEIANKTLATLEQTRIEMHEGFNLILNSIQDVRVENTLSKLNNFIQYFVSEKEQITNLPQNEYLVKLQEPNNILLYLKESRTPRGDSLRTPLYDIIQQDMAIPKDANDKTAFNALYALHYGTQTYATVMFFLLKQYSFLANYWYEIGNIDKYNNYFDLIITSFRDFKHSLVGSSSQSLIDDVINTIRTVQSKNFIINQREDIFNRLQQKIDALNEVKMNIEEIKLPMILDIPEKLVGKPNFKDSKIYTPIGQWQDGTKLTYAIQYKHNNTFSKVGEWSKPFNIKGKANPFIRVPVDPQRRTRLIFRKFNSDNPQLVGILEDKYQTEFRDIDRDLYNAAAGLDEDTAINEVDILISNGANVNTVFDLGRQAIHAAALGGNPQLALKFLIQSNTTDVNIRDQNGYSPISIASECGHDDFIKFLIANGADVNTKTNLDNLSPLHIAAYKGYSSTVETLMGSDTIDVNVKDSQGFTPLHTAVFGGVPDVKVLISNPNIDVNAKSNNGLSPLHLAAINNHYDIADVLVSSNRSIDLNAGADGNLTALHFASMTGNIEIVKLLINQNETNINAKSINDWTPLHFAISLEKEDVALELLSVNSTNVLSVGEGNVTFLHLAATTGQANIVLRLLEKEPSLLDKPTQIGLTALHFACTNSNKEVISSLIRHGAKLERKTSTGLTCLHSAVSSEHSNFDTMKYLISVGADLTAIPNGNETFLHLAAKSGNLEKVKYFIQKDYKVNGQDALGNTPLHFAAESGHLETVTYLIQQGANTSIKNNSDKTLLHFAVASGNLNVVVFCIEKSTDVNAKDKDRYTPLYIAVENGNLNILKYLIDEKDANINVKSVGGNTVLHVVVSKGDLGLVKYLCKRGADVNAKNDNAMTPLLFAAKNGHLNIVKYFIEEHNVVLNSRCNLSSRPLAAYYGHLEIVKYLVSRESGSIQVFNHYVSLLAAAKNGHVDIFRYLTKLKLNLILNTEEYFIKYPLQLILNINSELNQLYALAMTFLLMNNIKLQLLYLTISIQNGHLNMVEYFIKEKHINVNMKMDSLTILHLAAYFNSIDIVKYLINVKKADLNVEDKDCMTPALIAAKKNNFNVVEYLVEMGANITSSCNRHPLIFAAANGNIEMTTYLIHKGIDINSKFKSGQLNSMLPQHMLDTNENENKYYDNNILCNAIRNGHIDVVKYLVHMGADINATNENNSAPLIIAAVYGYIDIVKYFVEEQKVEINFTKTGYNQNFLENVAKNGHFNIIKYILIENHIQDISINYNNILSHAVRAGDLETVKYLLEEKSARTQDILHNGVKSGSLDLVKYLVDIRKISVNSSIRDFLTYGLVPLHYAAKYGHINIVKYLISEKHTRVNIKDSYNWTPIHYAANNGHLDVVKYLIEEQNADFNIKGTDGKTPLMCAIKNSETFLYIIKKGGNNICRQGNEETCLIGAINYGKLDLLKYLVDNGKVDVNFSYSSGFLNPTISLLAHSLETGNSNITKYLIEKGANIHGGMGGGLFSLPNMTYLHYAASNDDLDLVQYFVEKGANINANADLNLTPERLAIINCNTQVAHFLKSKSNIRNTRNVKSECMGGNESGYLSSLRLNSVASDAPRPTGWINNIYHTIVNSVMSISTKIYSSFTSIQPVIQSYPEPFTISLHNTDINSTLLLADVLIKKITNQKYITNEELHMPLLEAVGCALNITDQFERLLRDAIKTCNIPWQALNIDLVNIQKLITKKIMSGKLNDISKILTSYVKQNFLNDNQALFSGVNKKCINQIVNELNVKLYDMPFGRSDPSQLGITHCKTAPEYLMLTRNRSIQ